MITVLAAGSRAPACRRSPATINWADTALLCQNVAPFDGLILSHHYGFTPALYLCSLAMSRMALPRRSTVLNNTSALHFGLEPKGTAVNLTKGWRDIPPHVEVELGAYACHDADLAHEVFRRLLPSIPEQELLNIDATVRMFTQPQLELDVPKARKLLAGVIRSKRLALRRPPPSPAKILRVGDKFSALLDDRFRIDVALKPGKPTAGRHAAMDSGACKNRRLHEVAAGA